MTGTSKKLIILVCVLLSAAFAFGGCSKEDGAAQGNTASNVQGESWAYVHEPETEILRLGDDGRAIYQGKEYSYVREGDFLTFTDDKGNETKVRFVQGLANKMLLYERTEYHYAGSKEPDGIIGFWQGGPEDRLAYEFTTKGTFLEDGTFPGHYSLEEGNKIKLMYNDHFEDAYLYYELDGKKLVIDYPWPVVKTKEAGEAKEAE